jgi:hypothetical protein
MLGSYEGVSVGSADGSSVISNEGSSDGSMLGTADSTYNVGLAVPLTTIVDGGM